MLAKGDVLKFDSLLRQNIVWFMNMIAYFKDKSEHERKVLENERKKHRF
jgi:hypothetical protein